MKPPERPKRPYKNLEDFRQDMLSCGSREFFDDNPTFFPCNGCWGQGWIYDPDDPPCPIEGYKVCRRINCPACCGSRRMPATVFRAFYKERIDHWKQALKQWEYDTLVRKTALAKLTEEEIKVLGL